MDFRFDILSIALSFFFVNLYEITNKYQTHYHMYTHSDSNPVASVSMHVVENCQYNQPWVTITLSFNPSYINYFTLIHKFNNFIRSKEVQLFCVMGSMRYISSQNQTNMIFARRYVIIRGGKSHCLSLVLYIKFEHKLPVY